MLRILTLLIVFRTGLCLEDKTVENAKRAFCKYPEYNGHVHTTCKLRRNPRALIPLTKSEKQSIVDEHNKRRGNAKPQPGADLEKMYWDDELAETAEAWAELCVYAHDKNRWSLKYNMNAGQNIAFTTYPGVVDYALNAWWDEWKDFVWNQGSTKVVGHYTQMAMSQAVRIGCAKSKCGGKYLFACNYLEPNTYGKTKAPYTPGPQASACPKYKSGGLCDCGGKFCANGGTMDVENCKCKCTKYWGGDECTEEPVCEWPNCLKSHKGCIHTGPFWTAEKCHKLKKDPDWCNGYTCGGQCHGEYAEYCPFMCALCNPDVKFKCEWPNCLESSSGCMNTGPFLSADKCPQKDPGWCSNFPCAGQCREGFKHYCPYKCALCKPGSVKQASSCSNLNDRCEHWASFGECQSNSHWMESNCAKACNTCKG